jgi:hypothetical protein
MVRLGMCKDKKECERRALESVPRLIAVLQQQCDRGEASQCVLLGLWYSLGGFVDKDDARAAALFKRACDAGEMRGCEYLGNAFGQGAGVDKDTARAASLFRRACGAGNTDACDDLATMNLPPNEAFAYQLTKECGRGVPPSCALVVVMAEKGGDIPSLDRAKLINALTQGCRAGVTTACDYLKRSQGR